MSQFVLDCSVTMSWCLIDETNSYADAVLNSFNTDGVEALTPQLWSLEVANVLLVAERRGRITQAQTTRVITLLQALPIVIDLQTAQRAMGDTLALGRSLIISAYDAAYLELAMREGLPLATIDERLAKVANSCGVQTYLSVT
ncbi:PilT domain-containing protein [Gloeocapsa sp. PCC 7428]|uniref:type II toxin-antitoxin system VapC family toxin n=1 Tax=Gloeocapsa sp. PCC 7428 TaxID=1173026 RepID=UPI0002A5D32F|nr:type II toxin-antitoxin system VapC family toxin [Gloeocapsa sp. PCC 7428]AFZ31107.1 PilT domain-containing protein [Gloeocapsa sp. PCC 7428]